MAIRVHHLAKELGMSSKDLIKECQKRGLVRITKHMNSLSDGEARMMREELARREPPPQKPEPKAPPRKKPAQAKPKSAKPETAGPAPPPEPASRRERRRKKKEQEEKARKTGRGDSKMTFTDFTSGGTYSDRMAGSGVDYQRRARPKRPGRRRRQQQHEATARPKAKPEADRKTALTHPITVRDLSAAIGVRANEIIRTLMENGLVITINNPIPQDMVEMVGLEYGWEIEIKQQESIEEEVERQAKAQSDEDLEPRIPVVTMLGHVDHGKTSLLDRIRDARVIDTESGGITQHIGAYTVDTEDGKQITFLDTPGHEAFTAMRARGADCTDVAVLVVAADDGVMPQTREAISHAKAAEVPIVIALNKMDLPAADPARVKPQFGAAGLELEEWGGDVPCVEVSAQTGQGIDDLLEMILLVAELRELKANPTKSAVGSVLEGHMAEGLGPVATVLVREGTLRVGDIVLCGATFGRVRSMQNDAGKEITEAGPSLPVMIAGLADVPEAGDQMLVVDDLQRAQKVAEIREHRARVSSLMEQRQHITLDNLFGKIKEGEAGEVNVVLKADVNGSLGPLQDKLNGLSTDEVRIRILHSGVGSVNESDVVLADASDAIIIAYRVLIDNRARMLADEKNVDIRSYQVIYQPVEDMRAALSGLLPPERREEVIGHAQVLQVFRHSRVGNIAGCRVTDGSIPRDARLRIARDGVVIQDGAEIDSLRRVKEDISEAQAGSECGLKIAKYEDIKEGDIIEAYRVEEIARTL